MRSHALYRGPEPSPLQSPLRISSPRPQLHPKPVPVENREPSVELRSIPASQPCFLPTNRSCPIERRQPRSDLTQVKTSEPHHRFVLFAKESLSFTVFAPEVLRSSKVIDLDPFSSV